MLHKMMRKPGKTNVQTVNVMAYHNEFGSEKYGVHTLASMLKRYGAKSKNGGIVASRAINQPHAKP